MCLQLISCCSFDHRGHKPDTHNFPLLYKNEEIERGGLSISRVFFFLSLPLFLKAGSYAGVQATLEVCAIQADPKLMAVLLPQPLASWH